MNEPERFAKSAANPVIDLAERAPFTIGRTRVDPPSRSISAAEQVTVEPRVMQVLVALQDADGGVVPRKRLIDQCWSGLVVGDDAINRAIGELRRAATAAGADFAVETIARVGYRLKPTELAGDAAAKAAGPASGFAGRRAVLVGAGVLALGGGGLWAWRRGSGPAPDPRIEQARQALRAELPESDRRAADLLQPVVARDSGNAQAWGMLALAWRNIAEYAPSAQVSAATARSEQAARRALDLDPGEGNALTALATMQPYLGDWFKSEQALLAVLKRAPRTTAALSHLTTLYQSSGLMVASRQYNDRGLALDPLSPVFQFRAALKHWIFGEPAEADLAIDRALQVWPTHPGVWNARLMLFAYTDRAAAALALLDNPSLGPGPAAKPLVDLWRVTLAALATRSAVDIEHAVAANLAAVRLRATQAINAMMVLSALGRLDDAFLVARGYYLAQGPYVAPAFGTDTTLRLPDQVWKRSMMLFTPATRPMREDARFAPLCEEMGLAAFWRHPDHAPDYARFDGPLKTPG